MISFVQIAGAMAAGAIMPVTALLSVELYRLRLAGRAARDQPQPERAAGPDAASEIVAQLAAAQFEQLATGTDSGCSGREGDRSRPHLTLVSRRPPGTPSGKRSSAGRTADASAGRRASGSPAAHR